MSRQVGSLHRSISYPANLQSKPPIIPVFAFFPAESLHANTSASMDSDTNSNYFQIQILFPFFITQTSKPLTNLPHTTFPSHPQSAQSFVNHPLHTNTKEFLQICLHFLTQNTYFHSDPIDNHPHYVNEHVLYPTLSWTSFFHFTNTLSLPLDNTPYDNDHCSTQLYHLTTALTPKQFYSNRISTVTYQINRTYS